MAVTETRGGGGDQARRKRPPTSRAAGSEDEHRPPSKRRGGGGDGIYVPPHRAAADDGDEDDRSGGDGHQRRSWDALRRSITGLVNRATAATVRHVAPELLAENLVRGRGLLCRALIRSQAACPALTDVFAALAAAVNAGLPRVGRLLLVRLVLRLSRAHAARDAPRLAAAAKFVAHLVNQGVAHDLLALELLTLLLDDPPTDAGVEVAVGFVTECGAALSESCPRGLDAAFDRLRSILHDGDIEKRTQFMIEELFAIRRANFKSHPPVRPELDLVEPEDQTTHLVEIPLDDNGDHLDPETHLDVFKPSPSFLQDEAAYEDLKRSLLGHDGDEEDKEHASSDESECTDDDDDEESDEEELIVRDKTETDLTNLRRTIYLTLMSSAGSEEAGHKLLSVVRPGQEAELCAMLLECCRKEKACTSFYGELGQRLCAVGQAYRAGFEACFASHYAAAHRMSADELRAAAGLFARLLAADDALPWRGALGRVRVTEEDTTSSSRIFLKMLFLDLADRLGVRLLARRMNDGDAEVRDALFPRDCAKNTRFAVNFFTAIGLGGVTEPARKLLS
ncbi:hypothetical protein ACP70R_009377 [Stipagrostis hirtigluma subsp. patula]